MAVTKVVMPKLSEAMETGKLLRWLKQEGDRVSGGDIVAEIETDKADIELEAFGAGVVRRLVAAPGATVPVGQLIAVIADPDEDITAVLGEGGETPGPAAPALVGARPPSSVAPAPTGSSPAPATVSSAPGVPEPSPPTPDATAGAPGRVKASPLARRLAQRAGIDLRTLAGTGPGGRIVQRDVEAAQARGPAVTVPATPGRATVGTTAGVGEEDLPLSPIRAAIARQMAQSKGPVPHFYITTEIAMERAVALREELQALGGAPRVTVTDLLVRACAVTLVKHPGVNASFQGSSIRRHRAVHIGLAVALDEGLITPVLRDCDAKSVFQIAAETRDLVERTRARKLKSHELSGATFSLSNLGMFPVDDFVAIINPPEGAILAVGAIVEKPVVVAGQLAVGKRMRVTLSCDHRAIDGAMGARFLADLKTVLEAPLGLLV